MSNFIYFYSKKISSSEKKLNNILIVYFFFLQREFADYIEWLNSLYDPSADVEKTKKETEKYSGKLADLRENIEKLMETFFTYDGIYTELNKTYSEIDRNRNQINNYNSEINEWIKDGRELIEESEGCLIDAQNNFEVRRKSQLVKNKSLHYFFSSNLVHFLLDLF